MSVAEGDGISHDVRYVGLWGAIKTFPMRQPFMFNVIFATSKTVLGDLIVQRGEGKKEGIDWDRNAVFACFGFAYLGIVQWIVYVSIFTRICPNAIRFSNLTWAEKLKDRPGQIDLVKQTAYDNFIHYTFVYFPVFYTFKEGIQSKGKSDSSFLATFQGGMAKYWKNCVWDNLYMWAMWIPGDLAVYACPIWLRLPLNHGIGLVWTMFLSTLRGAEK